MGKGGEREEEEEEEEGERRVRVERGRRWGEGGGGERGRGRIKQERVRRRELCEEREVKSEEDKVIYIMPIRGVHVRSDSSPLKSHL